MTTPRLVHLHTDADLAVMVIDNPPVNALSPTVAAQIDDALDAFDAAPACRALVLTGAGRTFVAGGDIAAFEDPGFSALPINRTLARLERQRRPVVAALHGHVLGGGLELAMACHWRVADAGAQLGLPEVTLGLIPGSLGTQRLPRLVGLKRAFAMIDQGLRIPATTAAGWGLVDQVVEAEPGAAGAPAARAAQAWARQCVARPTRELPIDRCGVDDGFFARQRARAYADRSRFPAALMVVDALEAAAQSFDVGELVEARGFELARQSPESQALRHLFFAERKAARSEPEALQRLLDRAQGAFVGAIARSLEAGVSAARLARALSAFGFAPLPPPLACHEPQTPAVLDEPWLLWPLLDAIVDAAAQLLDEGACTRASDIDVAWTRHGGFPRHLGGPLYNADASGLARVVERLAAQGLAPCRRLRDAAARGERLSDGARARASTSPA